MASSGQTPAAGGAGAQGMLRSSGGPATNGGVATVGGYKAGIQPGGSQATPQQAGLGAAGNNLASMFMGNQGYGGGPGGALPTITQPTRESMGLPDVTKMIPPPRQPIAPTTPTTRVPTGQEIQQRIAQMQPNGATQMYSQNGGVNAMDANSGGKAQRFADEYMRMKYRNPTRAAEMLERSPYKSIFAPVQNAQPQQPYQLSQAALMARRMNERP